MFVSSAAADFVYTPLFTVVHGSLLRASIENAGLDPDNLDDSRKKAMDFGSGGDSDKKAWRDIWSAGQGIGSLDEVLSTHQLVDRLELEFNETKARGARA